ncbi:helix-turn-helix domain-containing protein [Streptomyces abikoensis]|uniref:Helix-turn-helix domain-containing protein n=1 Tax=Streptomyces abikoensis TaxID=97398 RepID=A0ABW7TF31_9ACTN
MSDFDAIDSLLAGVGPEAELPSPQVRQELREQARLSKAQVARALGVSPSTVAGWESGRDPAGEIRTKYAYLLDGLAAKFADTAHVTASAAGQGTAPATGPVTPLAGASSAGASPLVPAGPATSPEELAELAELAEGGDGVEAEFLAAPGPEVAVPAGGPPVPSPGARVLAEGTSPEPAVSAVSAGGDEVEVLAVPEPCVLCGYPAGARVAGFVQHLDPGDCHTEPTAAAPAAPVAVPAVTASAAEPAVAAPAVPSLQPVTAGPLTTAPSVQPATAPVQPKAAPAGMPAARTSHTTARPSGRSQGPARRAFQEPSGPVDLIGQAVKAALAEHHGDVESATAALLKRAIPDAMRLLDETRKGARYDVIAHPWIPDILRKRTSRGADQVWEARPKWTRHELPPGRHQVTALDINGAYLSALKTHLPLGQLEHSAGLPHDRRRAGVHLITPPPWEHEQVLPNPIGQRDEPGPLWVTEPTLRLLLRLSGPKYALCAPPVIHESYTSGATENLLEKFRIALKEARDTAIAQGDEVTLEYVKAMYSKFVSTMGESNYNRELYRPDWMHIIRSQAFANLWLKALKAHDEGLTVVRAMGTDELHVIGDWHRVFPEGRAVTEVKVKDTYTAGTAEYTGTEGKGEE